MHCASLGEFEQGRPVIERLRVHLSSQHKILLTFFSPSGYEVNKAYKGADFVHYLPMDSTANAVAFFDIVKPSLMLLVKYDFWYYYLAETKKRNVPLLLISGIFRTDQPFFKWYGSLHRQMLTCFSHLFVQNETSVALLNKLGFKQNVTIGGDTRFDRVIEIAENFKSNRLIDAFCGQSKVVVAGSTWTEDDKELSHFVNTRHDIKFLIAPHNIGSDRRMECLRLYQNSSCYSQLEQGDLFNNSNTLIIDNIGMLSTLYNYATVCYVGGGFGADGVHNVLEPAVFGKPVIFGPVYEKYYEAKGLLAAGGAVSAGNAIDLEKELTKYLDEKEANKIAGKRARQFVYDHAGSTEKIIDYIQEKRLLTS